ncbi:patatin-like phospholipase family protein [Kitasatospora aureofaciens]|uniref:patatin-like phospholipase family protein n=1 Tax=Kitasatospora aureofaciens TaxID=1894 RepID=UPI001C478541|nr:patatin-like phospholipase family protein [Kitasatospora aureofaciens]MBV6699989.1 patatin-like phospholipase family protein [Kitasatospora aureofaciens]
MTDGHGTDAVHRALILAGGGLKVAFQAGVLQVWLDEAGRRFDHADGASGGVFNLAMYCQGMSGRQIADNWRRLRPLKGVTPNWSEYLKGPYAASLFTLDGYRRHVFRSWGLDWEKIRATDRVATFNLYDFSANELEVLTADQMDEDRLCAAVSLPMWFPPVVIDGRTYIDAVYVTDANIGEAIRRGCDELWIIWTVSQRRRWYNGFVANYFQIIETVANSRLQEWQRRIEASNAAVRAGGRGEFGRFIEIKLLQAEVPLNYLINFSQERFRQAVELGVQTARSWCVAEAIPLSAPVASPPDDGTCLRFTERMTGTVAFGAADPGAGPAPGDRPGEDLSVHLTICADGLDRFLASPRHEAVVSGEVHCEALGGRRPVESGTFNLFVEDSDPEHLRMLYRLFFTDRAGHPLTLSGCKNVSEDSGHGLWADTTTLYTRILRGHLGAGEEEGAEVVAAGVIHIHLPDFLRQLATFRVRSDTALDRLAALGRFGQFFAGRLWDVYGQGVLAWSPI